MPTVRITGSTLRLQPVMPAPDRSAGNGIEPEASVLEKPSMWMKAADGLQFTTCREYREPIAGTSDVNCRVSTGPCTTKNVLVAALATGNAAVVIDDAELAVITRIRPLLGPLVICSE